MPSDELRTILGRTELFHPSKAKPRVEMTVSLVAPVPSRNRLPHTFRSLRRAGTLLALWSALIGLAGCGTYVPDVAEPPINPGDSQLLVNAIASAIHCELNDAVFYVISQDKASARVNGRRTAAWFDEWGVQGALTLTISEKTELNPNASWIPNPVTVLFTLAGGVDVSSQATRTDTLNFYYSVDELNKPPFCTPGVAPPHPSGSFLITSDLKLRDWLLGIILSVGTGATKLLLKNGDNGAVTHDVKFELVTSANITPSWKLRRVSINPAGNLFSTNRDRTHELLLTFGPFDKEKKTLVGAAADQFFASQVGSALTTRLRTISAP